MKKIIVSIFCGVLFLPAIVLAAFTANGNITVSQVTFGSGFADLMILSGSASDSWSFSSGVFSVENPGVFKIGSADATVKSIIVNNGSADVVCSPNSVPGASYVTLPTAAGTYTIKPSATADCCPAVANAATYNPFPSCGPATCAAGFSLTGGQCFAVSSSGGGGGGSLSKAPLAPGKSPADPLGIFQILIDDGTATTTDREVTINFFSGSDTARLAVSNNQDFSFGTVENFQAIKQWDICAGSKDCPPGQYIVYAKFFTAAGVASPAVSASIILTAVKEAAPAAPPGNPVPAGSANASGAAVGQLTLDEAQQLEKAPPLPALSALEQASFQKILALANRALSDNERAVIAQFIKTGTPSTIKIGSGERGGSIASFQAAFGRLPETVTDWQDVIKVATGHWTSQTNPAAENRAKINFKLVYLRNPEMKNPNDNAAVTLLAYGLRPAHRNLLSEVAAIKTFRFIYHRSPVTAREWNVIRAIAYSGAKK